MNAREALKAAAKERILLTDGGWGTQIQLRKLAEGMGILVGPESWASAVRDQSIFHESQFTLLLHDFERRGNNLGLTYFHGRPGTEGFPEFDACFEALTRRHEEIDRVQVTNAAMEEVGVGRRRQLGILEIHPGRESYEVGIALEEVEVDPQRLRQRLPIRRGRGHDRPLRLDVLLERAP